MVEEIKRKGQPFLVVDNFNSLCKSLDISPEKIVKDLIDFIQESNLKTIIVSDQTNEILENMADGIIEIISTLFEGRIFRKMLLRKLHGIEVKTPIYHFTLNNKNFKYFPIVNLGSVLKSMLKKPLYFKDNFFMDGVIDRLGINLEAPILLIELNTNSAEEISYIFLTSMAAMLLRKSYSGIITPMRSEDAAKFLAPHTDITMKLLNYIHFLYPRIEEVEEAKLPQSFTSTIQKNMCELKNKNKTPIFLILRYDLLREIIGKDATKRIIREITPLSTTKNDICIVVTSHLNKIENEELRRSSSAIIRVFEEHGRIFCYGEKPYTQIFGITFQERENRIELNFTPIT